MVRDKIIDDELIDFVGIDQIVFDKHRGAFTIKDSSIPLEYSNIRNLLLDFGFFRRDEFSMNTLIIDEGYLKILGKKIRSFRRKITLEEFKEQLKQK